MAKFVYRMQSILNIKLKMEEQAKNSFAIARMKLDEEEERLESFFAKKREYEDEFRLLAQGSISVLELNACKNAIEYTKNQIKRQLVEVKVAGKNLEAAQLRLNEAVKERKIQEKLREKAFDEFLVELNEEEKKEIDELVSYRFEDSRK